VIIVTKKYRSSKGRKEARGKFVTEWRLIRQKTLT
jgi:hypothetical protein